MTLSSHSTLLRFRETVLDPYLARPDNESFSMKPSRTRVTGVSGEGFIGREVRGVFCPIALFEERVGRKTRPEDLSDYLLLRCMCETLVLIAVLSSADVCAFNKPQLWTIIRLCFLYTT